MLQSVQTVGNFTSTFVHPLVAAGTAITMQGNLLDTQFFTSAQMMDNSKRKALVGGSTVAITNSVKAGDLTYKAIRISDNVLDGDIILIAETLKSLSDSQGGVIQISYGMNGATQIFTFAGVVVKNNPPLLLAGNDLPEYTVVFSYGTYTIG